MIIELNPLKWFGSKPAVPAVSNAGNLDAALDTDVSVEPSTSAKAVESNVATNKFVSLLEAVGKDFQKGLTFVVKYLPSASALASLIFPAAAAPLAAATSAAGLIQNAVTMAEQKYAAAGVQTGTGTAKATEVLQLASGAVTGLLAEPQIAAELAKAGITVDSTYISNLVTAVVGILNVQPAPAAG